MTFIFYQISTEPIFLINIHLIDYSTLQVCCLQSFEFKGYFGKGRIWPYIKIRGDTIDNNTSSLINPNVNEKKFKNIYIRYS